MEDEHKIKSLERVIEEKKPKRLIVLADGRSWEDMCVVEDIKAIVRQYGMPAKLVIYKDYPNSMRKDDIHYGGIMVYDLDGNDISKGWSDTYPFKGFYNEFGSCLQNEDRLDEAMVIYVKSPAEFGEDENPLMYRLSFENNGNAFLAARSFESEQKGKNRMKDKHKVIVPKREKQGS